MNEYSNNSESALGFQTGATVPFRQADQEKPVWVY